MFAKISALALITLVIYHMGIFLIPEWIDTYGHQGYNEKVRMLKRAAELDRAPGSTFPLIEGAQDIGRPYIEEGKSIVEEVRGTIETTKNIINTKTEQAREVIEATRKVQESLVDVQGKLDTLTGQSGSVDR